MIQTIKSLVPEWARRLVRPAKGPTPIDSLRSQLETLRSELQEIRTQSDSSLVTHKHMTDRVGTVEGSLTGVWSELAALKQYTMGLRETYPGLWWKDNLFELSVAMVLRDLCKQASVVWDCGANVGGLSVLMSRLVGPRGVVCSFEASPRVMDECLRNIVMNGCSNNVTLYHSAVYHTSDQTIPIYYGHHNQSDSVVPGNDPSASGQCVRVPTLALDDFVHRTGLIPDVIKMDIEGAEYNALLGMQKTIVSARPHMILETSTEDNRCLNLLRSLGYIAIDLGTYREVKTEADYPERSELRNLIYIHESRLDETGYRTPFEIVEHGTFTPTDFVKSSDGSLRMKATKELPAGRYVVIVDASANGTENQIKCGVRAQGNEIQMYWCDSAHLFKSYREWVFCLPESTPVELFFEFQAGTTDPTFAFRSATFNRLTRFDTRLHPRVG